MQMYAVLTSLDLKKVREQLLSIILCVDVPLPIELDVEDHYSDASLKKRKNKSGKKSKKGHGNSIVSTSTLLHSSMF